MLGRHCGLATLCTACHPDGLHPGDRDDCHGFAAVDVAECNVGQSCDGCGKPLLAGQAVA